MIRQRVKSALYRSGDWLCAKAGARSDRGVKHPWLFEIGHQVGELGWKLRKHPANPGRTGKVDWAKELSKANESA